MLNKKSVVYQIYPRSFYDSNDDGIGDIKGIINKLDYLKELGVDYCWITPIFQSPMNDNGYDISNYLEIDSLFGDMNDFDLLMSKANELNIKIMLDMVLNHTSINHDWFKKAVAGNIKYQNYYYFLKGKDKPSNWQSKFGGSTWKYLPQLDCNYLHLFDETQADLNWSNAEVRNDIFNVVNFWLNKGVKGLRFDVINLISKPVVFEDDHEGDGRRFYTDGAFVHKYLKELNEKTMSLYDDVISVGEMSSTTINEALKYTNPQQQELSMVFNFHHLKVDYLNGDKWAIQDFDFIYLKQLFNDWQSALQDANGWQALFWSNHDQPRVSSRFIKNNHYYIQGCKMLATAMYLKRGTPYIFQGEEIGMSNPNFDDINQYKDVETINYYNILMEQGLDKKEVMNIIKARSRDNSRTPMQWDNETYSGFSNVKPWIELNKNYPNFNVKKQLNDENSIYNYYKNIIKLRKIHDVISDGFYKQYLTLDTNVYVYTMTLDNSELLVICNFYDTNYEVNLPLSGEYKFVLSNYNKRTYNKKLLLNPYEAIVYIK